MTVRALIAALEALDDGVKDADAYMEVDAGVAVVREVDVDVNIVSGHRVALLIPNS